MEEIKMSTAEFPWKNFIIFISSVSEEGVETGEWLGWSEARRGYG